MSAYFFLVHRWEDFPGQQAGKCRILHNNIKKWGKTCQKNENLEGIRWRRDTV